MAQQAPSSSPFTYEYDVFLSFRGVDTRTGFTGTLYSALNQRGIMTFFDDKGLRKGEEITASLLNAIQQSRMAIIIFSKDYASSTFCLNELVQILECHRQQKMQILPVFYDVDPSQVRYQKGSYGQAFSKHEQRRFKDNIEQVQKWRLALRQVADLSGWHLKHGGEYEHVFVRNITKWVSDKLNRPLLHIADFPVGLKDRMQDIQGLIGGRFDEKLTMLGIYGTSGVGKSTLARAIYNSMAHQFEGSCFLVDVSDKSTKDGLVQKQKIMLSKLLGEKKIKLGDVNEGISILQGRLRLKKVLLILDAVDKREQLQATAGGPDWFGPGSIIIITTRDKHLLDIHGVENQYEVNELNDTEALELFRWHAFKNKEVDPNYMEIIKQIVYYANGFPLALEIIGSNLFGKTLHQWKSALESYVRIPSKIQEILRISYDGLEEHEKEIFLDIACFFKGCTVRYVTDMLRACGCCGLEDGIRVLEDKSLIKISCADDHDDIGKLYVTMHNLIQCMGEEIVIQQSSRPEKRNRVWLYEDVICILENNKENHNIEAMMLDMPKEEVQLNQEDFRKMKNLKMLIIKNAYFFGSPEHLPSSLRVLEWRRYPGDSLPSNFQSRNLVLLQLSYSPFQWDQPLKKSKVLRHLIFTGCKNIRQIPDLSGFPNLTELCVDKCTNLIEIHDSVGSLEKLQRFSAKRCRKLKIGPPVISLPSLEYLCLRDCSSLTIFPEIAGPMQKLEYVDLGGTAIKNLALSMLNLEGLRGLCLDRCKKLESKTLSNFVQMLPICFPRLENLYLQYTNLTVIPECIEQCHFLEVLQVFNCKQLQEIGGLPPSIINFSAENTSLNANSSTLKMSLNRAIGSTTIDFYILPGQRIPEWFEHSSRGNSLCFWFRKEMPNLTVCAITGVWDNIKPPYFVKFNFNVKINDIDLCVSSLRWQHRFCIYKTDHIIMLNVHNHMKYPMNLVFRRALSANEWIYGEVSFVMQPGDPRGSESIKWTGVYVNWRTTRKDDVRFTNPFVPNDTCDDSCYNNTDIQQQQLTLFNPTIHPGFEIGEHILGYVSSNSNSLETSWTVDSSNGQDAVFLDHQAMVPREPSQDPGFSEMQNIQAQSPTSSTDKERHEVHIGTSEEMEAFYASLDTQPQTHVVSCSSDGLATTALSKKAREALKTVQDFFISNDASVLLHPEQCSA